MNKTIKTNQIGWLCIFSKPVEVREAMVIRYALSWLFRALENLGGLVLVNQLPSPGLESFLCQCSLRFGVQNQGAYFVLIQLILPTRRGAGDNLVVIPNFLREKLDARIGEDLVIWLCSPDHVAAECHIVEHTSFGLVFHKEFNRLCRCIPGYQAAVIPSYGD